MSTAPRPYTLVAELTYRCPLRCVYCSNPVDFHRSRAELSTDEWKRVFSQAAELGIMQLHLSGGEPVLRDDLTELIRHARAHDLYTNLITGGTLLDEVVAKGRLAARQMQLHDAQFRSFGKNATPLIGRELCPRAVEIDGVGTVHASQRASIGKLRN